MSTKVVLAETPLTLASAKEALEKAIQEKQPLNLWVNKHGDLIGVTFEHAGSDEAACIRLTQDAPLGPSFPVCIVVRGRLLTNDGDPMSIADLPKAIKAAEAERVRFYTEREKEFGPSAWPHGAA
jgi:hypothetical protein